MKKTSILTLLLTVVMAAQGHSILTLKDITGGKLRGESVAAIRVLQGSDCYTMISPDWKRVVKCSFADGNEVETLFDATVNGNGEMEDIDDYVISPTQSSMLVQTQSEHIYRHSLTATYYVYNFADKSLRRLSQDGKEQVPVYSPDGTKIAFVRDNNIFLASLDDGSVRQITADGSFGSIINGIPDWVNEEEFGIDRAITFTPDGRHLLWVRYDESKVKTFSIQLYKGSKPEKMEYADYPGLYSYKYPIAGEQNSTVSLHIYDISSGTSGVMQLPLDADDYIPRLMPANGGSQVLICRLNRLQNHMQIYIGDAANGTCRQIIEETADKYIKEEAISGITVTDSHILLPSDRSGWMHLYLYDFKGRLERAVTSGSFEVSAVYGYDEKSGSTFFASHEAKPTGQNVWVALKNGQRKCLTPQEGWNTAVFSSSFRHFINTWSDIDTPPVTTIRDAKGRLTATLKDNRKLNDMLANYRLGKKEMLTITTSDGITLNAWMVKPVGFSLDKKYPVVMYQYGGPGNQQVRDAWNIGMAGQGAALEQYLCQQGYICVCVDNRGTGGRGAEFEKCTYLQLGRLEARDQAEAALWLSQQPYVDASRIAIWGWSFGGFNTLMAMSEGRGLFRAGIAIAPPTSWRYYDTIYTERFMRTPQENPSGYDDCPISRAEKLQGALLLCHGLADDNVHFRNTAEYTEALVQAGKDFRQLVYTNRNHSIYGGNTRHHLFSQCIDFFNQHLGE